MSVNGHIPHQCSKEPTPEQQLNYINHELRKCEIKRKSLEESRRELINRYNLNKGGSMRKYKDGEIYSFKFNGNSCYGMFIDGDLGRPSGFFCNGQMICKDEHAEFAVMLREVMQ